MNYTISENWTSLSTILGEAYDSSKKYRVHVNINKGSKEGLHWIEKSTTPTDSDNGSSCDGMAFEVYIDAGLGLTMFFKAKYNPVSVDITEVE